MTDSIEYLKKKVRRKEDLYTSAKQVHDSFLRELEEAHEDLRKAEESAQASLFKEGNILRDQDGKHYVVGNGGWIWTLSSEVNDGFPVHGDKRYWTVYNGKVFTQVLTVNGTEVTLSFLSHVG